MKVKIYNIGNEILSGRTINTNANFIARELTRNNYDVNKIEVIKDKSEDITNTLKRTLIEDEDIFIFTGGLGPTDDDITKKTIANFFNSKLIFVDNIYQKNLLRAKNRGVKNNSTIEEQAYIPDNCDYFLNTCGTAPCMKFKKKNKLYYFTPGVPKEMNTFILNSIIPDLNKIYKNRIGTYSISYRLIGITESEIYLKIKQNFTNFDFFYYPSYSGIDIFIKSKNEIPNKVKYKFEKIFRNNIISKNNESIEQVIANLLKGNKLTISTAESCTGGLISSRLTDIPGISENYYGSIISYSNKIKENILNIDDNIIQTHGAVSKQVAEHMAMNVREKLKTDIGISTTGIAGPSGGSNNKPIGTVWIGIAFNNNVFTKKFVFNSDREGNKFRFSQAALQELYFKLKGNV